MRDDFGDTVYSWIKDITIESEAVRSSIAVGWDRAAKTVQVDHLIGVVELKNVSNSLDSLQVLIVLRVEVVERFSGARISIRQSEVNSKCQINFTTTEYILEEGVLTLNLQVR